MARHKKTASQLARTTPSRRVFAFGAAVVLTGLVVGGVVLAQRLLWPKPSGTPLMAVAYRGGLCETKPCETRWMGLYDNGAFEQHERVNRAELDKLRTILATTDFVALVPPNGERPAGKSCPSDSDAADTLLRFPQKYGDRVFTTCAMTWSDEDPTLVAITTLIHSHEKDDQL
jgi:hypothetical protein